MQFMEKKAPCQGFHEIFDKSALQPPQPLQPLEPLEPLQPLEPLEPLEPLQPLEPLPPPAGFKKPCRFNFEKKRFLRNFCEKLS
jgi:hypothetical protein